MFTGNWQLATGNYLAQVKLEDVFKSTQESFDQSISGEKLLAGLLLILAVVILLWILQYRRKHVAVAKPLHSQAKLTREALKALPLRSSEMRQLKQLSEEKSLSSPLVFVLCPSLLAKAIQEKKPEERQALAVVVRKMGPKE
jgi:hypothetical protein